LQDLNDLHHFEQVVRHGGFSAASRATGEPKSKLSKRVAQLEWDLGVRPIERGGGGEGGSQNADDGEVKTVLSPLHCPRTRPGAPRVFAPIHTNAS
jgi:Bacterial regulatory helix-turn-helix protein, lysR family